MRAIHLENKLKKIKIKLKNRCSERKVKKIRFVFQGRLKWLSGHWVDVSVWCFYFHVLQSNSGYKMEYAASVITSTHGRHRSGTLCETNKQKKQKHNVSQRLLEAPL